MLIFCLLFSAEQVRYYGVMTIDSMFSTFDANKNKTTFKKKGSKGKPVSSRPARMNLSPQEIRDKVAKGLGKNLVDKTELSNSGKKWGDGFMDNNPEAAAVKKPASDINSNDPNDVITQEKLRGLVQKGGFNFSDKEKQVLAGILGNQ
jgi:hypothetical protein